jgi:ATP-dependent Lon protease
MLGEMEIPLFPLPNLVLFPHIVVPLHIFEERYKLMINECVNTSDVFGLILLRSGAVEESEDTIHRVGVTARIVEVERLAEGRMNILCEGERRFRIRRFTEQTPFWKGFVEFLDEAEPAGLESLYEQVADLYRSVVTLTSKLSGSQEQEIVLPESPIDLSYMVSYVLDIDFEEKQKLLEMDDVADRLRLILAHLTELIGKLQQQRVSQETMTKVRGNGDLGMPHSKN